MVYHNMMYMKCQIVYILYVMIKKHYATTINENVAKKFKSLKFRVEAEETENTILHWNIYIYTKEEQNKIMEELN